jgi:RND family efflux transporter MFP subunit
VARLRQLTAYKEVRAPFDGVITVRNCATGNLVTPNNQGRELFRMANNDVLRVFAALPQSNIPDVRVGDKAEVWIADRPNVRFRGEVARYANAIDEMTRTQRTEVRVTNRDNLLLPGMYVQVRFQAAKPRSLVLVPGDTLLTKAEGSFVAVVDGGKVRMQKVSLGRDLGATLEVTEGLLGGESLIVNPSDAVRAGVTVKSIPRK